MKLKDIIYSVADLINQNSLRQVLYDRWLYVESGFIYEYDTNEYNKMMKVINSVNLAIERIAREFMVFVTNETHTSNADKRVLYSSFTASPHEIIEAFETGKTKRAKCYVEPTGIVFEKANTSYDIKFRYIPDKLNETNLDDDVNLPCYIPQIAVCYAVASDWCLASCCFDEATIWNNKYEKCLRDSLRSVRERTFARRKFL